MATAASRLLQTPLPNLQFKTRRLYPLHRHPPQSPTRPSFPCFRVSAESFKTLAIVKSSFPDHNDSAHRMGFVVVDTETKKRNHFEILAEIIMNALKKTAAAALLVGLLLMYHPNSALAARSGGRMGGRAFSSRSSSSSSSSSRSYSAPDTSSGWSSSSSSSLIFSLLSFSLPSSESSSRSDSAPKRRSSSRSDSAPKTRSSSSSSSPSFSLPQPSSGSSSSSSSSRSDSAPKTVSGSESGDGSTAFFFMCAFVAFVLISGFSSGDTSRGSALTATMKTSVIKLQVGLLGSAKSLQKDLNRIAETADTSTPEGLHYVLTETIVALLRHPDYCISAYSSVDIKKNMEGGEKRFNQLSIEERGKFDEETLVNVNNIKQQSSTRQGGSGFSNEYIVITILVAAEGERKLPSINNSTGLKEALQKLASIPSSRTLAVEVLWTPQNEDDTLTEQELLEDYSLLRPL